MSDNKSYMQTEYELKEEIKSINDKGFMEWYNLSGVDKHPKI